MRIVYVWDADYPWDVRVEKICRSLTAAGHDVHIACRNRAWRPARERLPEGEVHRMPPWRAVGRRVDGVLGFPAFFSPRWVAHLRRVIRHADAGLVIVRDLPLCPTAIAVARRAGIPVVLDMAENYPATLQNMWAAGRQKSCDLLVRNPALARAVERWCLPRVDRVLVVVEESADRVQRLGVHPGRIDLVSNTPPRARALDPPPPPRDDGMLELLYLGLMEVPRGVMDLVRAVALLSRRSAPVRVVLVGGGRDLPLFRALTMREGVDARRVEFTGWVPRAEVMVRLGRADVGVVPNQRSDAWNTTIPNKLFDYMAAGLPVAGSDAAPIARIVRETGAGLVFRSRDPESLAAAVTALADPAARARMGAAGRAAVLRRYHWEDDASRLLAAVAAVAGDAASRARTPHPVAAPG